MTEEEKQELETLRQEKHQRIQVERARAILEVSGVPGNFAALLIGVDDAETDHKTAQFCATYQAALTEDVRKRLPQQAPVMTPPAPQRARRGIQRIR